MNASVMNLPPLNYDPASLPRETKRHYISASEKDIQEMLAELGLSSLNELFAHIPENIRFKESPPLEEELGYEELREWMVEISSKNMCPKASFIGDGLAQFKVPEVVHDVLALRELTTAYTPYQPERSQGTLMTHWVYQSLMSQLTGFEAINVSMYDRSTTLFEAMQTALRINKKRGPVVLVFESIYKGDLEVLLTLRQGTALEIELVPVNKESGVVDPRLLEKMLEDLGDQVSAVVFPHSNDYGCLEKVDVITDLCHKHSVKSIAVIDPMLLGCGGLKPPSQFGQKGSDIFVAEGQHVTLGPNFGGPGLGVFGIRYHSENKNDIRSTPGRFIGDAKDFSGQKCKTQVMSTREQHIKRERATSNICSNQAFVATIAGAALLARGEKGMREASTVARKNAEELAKKLQAFRGVALKFPATPFFNEFCITVPGPSSELIRSASLKGLHIGVDMTTRLQCSDEHVIKVSCSDLQSEVEMNLFMEWAGSEFEERAKPYMAYTVVEDGDVRKDAIGFPDIESSKIKKFYQSLAAQNISPDSSIYPLGSCTMKYNPYLNDYAASLSGFYHAHPCAPAEDVQGCLQIIYETQEIFKTMLGLKAVTTQPVAGAQGELIGLKMIQAYHRSKADKNRDIILIPRSAHGTNPATATVAGFKTLAKKEMVSGVVLVEAEPSGQINLEQLQDLVRTYDKRIAGIMITNPNTSGIFEQDFKKIANLIHGVGGLVYMDGANLNAIAGWLNLGAMGVDAVHSNTHKTWSIPHGGGGPGDAFVAVSEKLKPFLPGVQVIKNEEGYALETAPQSIGSCHRHFGNFAHKVRCYAYVKRLGREGVSRMSAVAVLSARYLRKKLSVKYPTLPAEKDIVCMHEFILTLSKKSFELIEKAGIPHSDVITRMGKLFLDFGFHAPTVAFPEVYGIMIEPTESYTKAELDRFADAVLAIYDLVHEHPEVLETAPHFTPVDRVDDVSANRNLVLSEKIVALPEVLENKISPEKLAKMSIEDISSRILEAHQARCSKTA